MATVQYVIQAINMASRVFNEVRNSAIALDLAMDRAEAKTAELNAAMARAQVPAFAMTAATAKLNETLIAGEKIQSAVADSLNKMSKAGALAAIAMKSGGDAAKAAAADTALLAAATGPAAAGYQNMAVKAQLATIAMKQQALAAKANADALVAVMTAYNQAQARAAAMHANPWPNGDPFAFGVPPMTGTRGPGIAGMGAGAAGAPEGWTNAGSLAGMWGVSRLTAPPAAAASWMDMARAMAMAAASGTAVAASARNAGAQTGAAANIARFAFGPWFGLWGLLFNRPKVQLFGGALTAFGLPQWIAAASAAHIATDAILEFISVIVPASVALGAFGLAAAPTFRDISVKMRAVYNDSIALRQSIYPMSGAFARLEASVKPEVYQLFGQALVVAQHGLGIIKPLAVSTGAVLDRLGARAAAALTSGGLATLIQNGPRYVQELGNIVANIFGTIGNLLRTVPHYAQYMLDVLQGLTGALEAITASPITQWFLRQFLLWHGFILWVGLAITIAVRLGNALLVLGARFGLAAEGATVFNAAQFGGGIRVMLAGVIDLGIAMGTLAGGEAIATAGTRVLAGAFAALDAVNPLVWLAAVGAALAFAFVQLVRVNDTTSKFVSNVQSVLGNQPIGALGGALTTEHAFAVSQIATTQKQLNALMSTGNVGANSAYIGLTTSAVKLGQTLGDNKALLPVLTQDTKNYAAANKAAGGDLSLLNSAGITSSDILHATTSQMAQYVIMIKAAAAAQQALALGTGRAAAAQNAQTNKWMTEMLPAMNNIISAEDAVTNMIVGGRQGFLAFEQTITGVTARLGTPPGLAGAAKVAGANLSGLNAASVNLANNFYNDAVPAAQSLIDKLEQQNISTGRLRIVVATEVAQMAQYTKGNVEAKSVMVDLINNALGPGTVTMHSFNSWVERNRTSVAGFNSIIAKSTVEAGNLAGTLRGMLNVQFAQLLYTVSGVGGPHGALAAYTADLLNSSSTVQQTASARQTLISDLEKTGMKAKTARDYVNQLGKQIDGLHGKDVSLKVAATGAWSVVQVGTGAGKTFKSGTTGLAFAASGMYVGTGRAGIDDQLIVAQKGELVVPAHMVAAGATAHLKGQIPGYASGGVVGSYSGTPPGLANFDQTEYGRTLTAVESSTAAAAAAAMQAAQIAAAFGGYSSGSGGANAALARRMYPPWGSGAEWAAWNYVGMRESGWSATAVNPSSGAAGIAQRIQGFGPGYAYGNAAQQIAWMISYIRGRYGDPIGAAAHERGFNWYDQGGYLRPGLTLAMNGTGRAERVIGPGEADSLAGNTAELVRLLTSIRDGIDDLVELAGTEPAAIAGALASIGGGRPGGLHGFGNTRG